MSLIGVVTTGQFQPAAYGQYKPDFIGTSKSGCTGQCNRILHTYEAPAVSGIFIASIRRPLRTGQYIFSDSAYYNAEENKWYKNDPFSDEEPPHGEEITSQVIGWIDNMTTFVGV